MSVSTDSLIVNHTSVLAAGEISATFLTTVTATLSANQATSSIASLMTLQPAGAAGNPSYFTGIGSQIDVPSVANNNLQDATIYALKGIINFKSAATSGQAVAFLIASEAELILDMKQTSGSTTINQAAGFQLVSGPFTTAAGGTTVLGTYLGLYVPAIIYGGPGTFTITNQWNCFFGDTNGGYYFGAPLMVIGAAAPAVGGVTHRGTGGIRTESANTQDAMKVVGRAGGSTSLTNVLTTAPLTGPRTQTFPDASMTFAATNASSTVTQITSRTTGVTNNAVNGDITLVSSAGVATYTTFTVTNSSCGVNDKVVAHMKSGTDIYHVHAHSVAAGSFKISFADLNGTTTETPVFTFVITKYTAA